MTKKDGLRIILSMPKPNPEAVRQRQVADYIKTHNIASDDFAAVRKIISDITGDKTVPFVMRDPISGMHTLGVRTGLAKLIETDEDAREVASMYREIDERMKVSKSARRLAGKVMVVG